MDSDQGKLFIGGISWETTEEKLKEHFEVYGEVLQTVVMKDKTNGRPRGFGFVVFADPAILDRVLQDSHSIEGRTVEAKRALSREEQQTSSRTGGSNNGGRNFASGGNYRTKKIFVGGLPPSISEDGFRQYFEGYGSVTDVVIMYDQQTQRPRGFGFISFESEDAVDRILQKNYHDLNGKMVEVKRALPKDANPGGGRSMGGGLGSAAIGGGGGYQGYGASGGNSGSYEGRIDSNRYLQSQNNGGTFPPYGSTGFNAPSYGYGVANNYGAYGGYGGANSGYVNPNGQRGSWNTQASSGYGPVGYGNPGSGGPVSATIGQSPGGTAGYGNQSYGYGGYGGNDGSYANQAAYGAAGGRPSSNSSTVEMHGNFGGYMDGSSGYGNQGWRSDPSGNYGSQPNGPASGGQVGYGGGYGGPAARQVQQQ
ncbi:heterogeneous nuclear ribonucleoprotein 1-like [Impatiens glandulifera]|uniref:heterogeneous nuclear ribonucleoprotein 1-like n=1 Tax=Impatiens glandulifera TaxID=253017 RepID=UPI001FB18A5D|nr:heterogeneous nuclear ribonucleoprotein 1-like [Impatiens glandulifera]